MTEEKKPADKVRKKLEKLRESMLSRFGERGCRRIFRGVVMGIIIFLALLLLIIFFPIFSIEVTGDVTMFNESEVIAAAEINEGDGLFWQSSWKIKKNIEKNMPIAQNIKVRKSLFGKVTINIELLSVDYYGKYGDIYYAFDEDMKVLDKNVSRTKYSSYGAVYVIIPAIREPNIGEKIVFYDTVEETDTEGETLYEVKDEKVYAYAENFLKELKRSGYHSAADGVILDEKFDVTLIYSQKFSIRFGTATDLDVKFRVLYEILAEGSMQYAEKASVDLSDPSKATARADLTLDFSEFID